MWKLEALNQTLFLAINGDAASPPWRVTAITGVAEYLILLIPIALTALWLRGGTARRSTALQAVAVNFLALGVNQLIGIVWQHPRPFALGLGHTFLAHAADSSFPSDHMTVFAAVGLVFLLGNARLWGAVILLLGIAVGWARVYLGLHFPLDMAGGVAVSAVTCLIVAPVWARLGDRLTQWMESLYRHIFAWPIANGWVRS